ncbi:MAG: type IV secretion system DNA-binding domain-containing protein [Thermoplasmata archaeon]
MKDKNFNVLRIMSSRLIFLLFFGAIIFDLHNNISNQFFNINSYVVTFGKKQIDIIKAITPYILKLKIVYYIITAAYIAIIADYIYRNFLIKFTDNNKPDVLTNGLIPPYPFDEDKLQLIIGLKYDRMSTRKKGFNPQWVIVGEKGMYQNFLITGTIGTGKTASAMYPFTKQALFYKPYDEQNKPGMLVLDVKGNYYEQVVNFAKEAGRLDDVIIIELGGRYKYNPLHKPDMKPLVLANRSKTVLSLFSPRGTSDGYWLDKAELLIAECIKLCRLYNENYVTFAEINKLVNNRSYLDDKLEYVENLQKAKMLSEKEEEIFETCREYFDNEYRNLSENTLSIIQSVVTQMTQFFYTDPDIKNTFCPPVSQLNFKGFKDVIDKGKIVILKMNIAEYRNVAKTIAAYMKLDFQSEVMQRLSRQGANKNRPVFFIADEYHEFVTSTDAEFYALSREPKCVSIVATQSYTSLINTLHDRDVVRTIIQNLINKIWLRTDDLFTVEEAQKHLGKEEKEKVSRSISENANDVKKNRLLGSLVADKSSISESINISKIKEFTFDEKLFTQILEVFTGVCFLSDGSRVMEPTVIHLLPYFSDVLVNGIVSKKSKKSNINDKMLNSTAKNMSDECLSIVRINPSTPEKNPEFIPVLNSNNDDNTEKELNINDLI